MPHTTIPKAPSPTKTESPKVRYTDVVYPYSGLFPFAANTTRAAKEKGLTVNKSIHTEKCPPEKVAYREKNWPNRVKKEFDTEGADENGAGGIQAYYFGARFYDPEIGVWFSNDPREQFFNPYGYATNPIVFIDENGESFTVAAIIIGAIIGAYTTTSAVEGTYNPGDWQWDGTTAGALVGGAIVGGVSAGVGSAVTTGVTGAVGIATSSGLGGAIAGGAAGGAVGGAIGYTGTYALQVGLTNKSWNTGEYFGGLGKSLLIGGIGGALGGALRYDLNPNGVNQEIIKWGYEHEKYGQTISFVQKAYNIQGNFAYRPFAPSEVPMARGNTITNNTGSGSFIYKNAFLDPKTHLFDPSSIVQVMGHEGFHQTGSILEYLTYFNDLLNETQHGLSQGIIQYLERRFAESFNLGY